MDGKCSIMDDCNDIIIERDFCEKQKSLFMPEKEKPPAMRVDDFCDGEELKSELAQD